MVVPQKIPLFLQKRPNCMEPVFMVMGKSEAIAASLTIDENIDVQMVAYPVFKEALLKDGQRIK